MRMALGRWKVMLKFATNHAGGLIMLVADSWQCNGFDVPHRCRLLYPRGRQRLAVGTSNPLLIGIPRPGFPHPEYTSKRMDAT